MKTYISYVLMVVLAATFSFTSHAQNTVPLQGDCENLFMSEITFGKNQNGNLWDLNYAVEIYNPTQNSISLSGYELLLTDLTQTTLSIPLSGTIAGGDVHVVCNDNADLNLQGMADQLASGMDFELYACLELKQNTVVLDKIGQKFSNNPNNGFDPVQLVNDPVGYLQNFDINLDDYENINLRRSFDDKKGDPVFSPAITAMLGHWSYHKNVDRSNIGTHKSGCYYTEADQVIGFFAGGSGQNGLIYDLYSPNQVDVHPLALYWQTNLPNGVVNYPASTVYDVSLASTASIGWNSIDGINAVGIFGGTPNATLQTNCNILRPNQLTLIQNCEQINYNSNINVAPPNAIAIITLSATTTHPTIGLSVDQPTNTCWIYFHRYPTAVNTFEEDALKVYPTIFYDNIQIDSKEKLQYEVFSMNGKVLHTGDCTIGENIISLGHLSGGVYLLKLGNHSGQKTIKIVKR